MSAISLKNQEEEKTLPFPIIVKPCVDPAIKKVAEAIDQSSIYVFQMFQEQILPNLDKWELWRQHSPTPFYRSHCVREGALSSQCPFSLVFLKDEILLQFRKKDSLGRGSYKSVTAAVNVKTKKLYASAGSIPPDQREVTFLRNLSRPGIIKLIASMTYPHCGKEEHEGKLKQRLILEYFPQNLFKVLQREKKLTAQEQKRIFEGLVRTIAYLHREHNLIHRDIKPSNILLDKECHPTLTDFGAACYFQETDEREEHRTTCDYVSYEYAHAMLVGNRKEFLSANGFSLDAHSLGITLAEVLYMGTYPWREIKEEEEVFSCINRTSSWPVFNEEYGENSPQAYVCRLTDRLPSRRLSIVDLEKKLGQIEWNLEIAEEKKS